MVCSNGIGLEYAKKNWERILKGETINGKKYPIPNYYKKKLASKEELQNIKEISNDKTYDTVAKYYNWDQYENASKKDKDYRNDELMWKNNNLKGKL